MHAQAECYKTVSAVISSLLA